MVIGREHDHARCEDCGRTSELELDALGRRVCFECFVPDITAERYQGTTEDFLVAAPNVRRVGPGATCPECGRTFDLLDPVDSDEWSAGHDCEPRDKPRLMGHTVDRASQGPHSKETHDAELVP